MLLTQSATPLHQLDVDWLVVPTWEGGSAPPALAELDRVLGNVIAKLIERGDITGKAKELTPILHCPAAAAKRLLIVGMGKRDQVEVTTIMQASAAAARHISSKAVQRVAFSMPNLGLWFVPDVISRAIAVGFSQGCGSQAIRKSKPERHVPRELILANATEVAGLQRASIECEALALARELVNVPPSELYPETFAHRALELAGEAGLECTVLDEKQLREERMGAVLAVAEGSARPPRMVTLRRRTGGDGPTLAIVGKGVTFDSGGLSLKTTDQMIDMKCDMAGAATTLAAAVAIAKLGLSINLLAVLPLVENMPGGRSMKLGDVITARNGKTIEVLNTDAEGRLILADALAYAVDHGAAHLIDLATLTGACMVALGADVVGLMANNDPWAQRILNSANIAGERAWQLPMFSIYGDMIKGGVADIRNTGGSRYAGAITAAKFLEQFVSDKPWAHLDIAGPAWAEKGDATRDAGGTGCFVRTLIELAHHYP